MVVKQLNTALACGCGRTHGRTVCVCVCVRVVTVCVCVGVCKTFLPYRVSAKVGPCMWNGTPVPGPIYIYRGWTNSNNQLASNSNVITCQAKAEDMGGVRHIIRREGIKREKRIPTLSVIVSKIIQRF